MLFTLNSLHKANASVEMEVESEACCRVIAMINVLGHTHTHTRTYSTHPLTHMNTKYTQ